jgi:hypothetical protein
MIIALACLNGNRACKDSAPKDGEPVSGDLMAVAGFALAALGRIL